MEFFDNINLDFDGINDRSFCMLFEVLVCVLVFKDFFKSINVSNIIGLLKKDVF